MDDHKKVINFKRSLGSHLSTKVCPPKILKFPARISAGYRFSVVLFELLLLLSRSIHNVFNAL